VAAPDGPIDLADIETFWVRRFGRQDVPDTIAAGDQIIARREMESFSFVRGIVWNLGRGRRRINDVDTQRAAKTKPAS
jgi:hypothetical protein